jgi:sporulation protein YlmC with PRC-barrel domain
MMKELLGATAAVALLTGVAMAQDAPAAGTDQPPAATGQPVIPPTEGQAAPGTAATDVTPATPPSDTAVQTPPAPETQAPETGTAAMPPAPETGTAGGAGTEVATGEPVSAQDVIGRSVVGSDGESLGSVADAIVDSATGKIQRLVISSGGFLGIGAKKVALDFEDVEILPEGGIRAKSVTQADIEGMPEFDVAAETKSLDAPPPQPVPGPAAPGAGGPAPAQ